jgi:hypothetical protein
VGGCTAAAEAGPEDKLMIAALKRCATSRRFVLRVAATVVLAAAWVALPLGVRAHGPVSEVVRGDEGVRAAHVDTGEDARPPSSLRVADGDFHSPSSVVAGGDAGATKGATQEKRISPQEAGELFRSVDEILKAAAQETGLPIKHEVKRRLTSRDEVVAYVTKHMAEDEDAQRLRRSEAVLKKFGLLPRDFNLETFLVAILKEQVAGYFDPKTKTVNLLDWVDVEQQRPVMAHELTHALQDQSFDLEKWMRAGETDLAAKKQPTPADIANDEATAARQAVVEGQATVALLDYLLTPTGQTVLTAPQLVEAMKAGMMAGTPDSVEFRKAPIYLKQAMLFGYIYGLDFTTALLKAGGKGKAFAGAFLNPPQTTRQIMEPATYLAEEKIDPMPLPDFDRDFKKYERFDIGAIGEFDLSVLLEQYAGDEVSKKLYPHWRGGYYYAVRPKGNDAAPLGLLYVSRWSDAKAAEGFVGVYAKALGSRYKQITAAGAGKAPGNQIGDRTKDVTYEGAHPPLSLARSVIAGGNAGATRTWLTEEGNVVITWRGDMVVVSESLDEETRKRVEKDVLER